MSTLGPNHSARPTLRVDLSAIKHNYKALQKRVGQTKIGASVKADAYGLGAARIGRTLYGAGCRNFFVATAGEGMELRKSIGDNASIYVLNGPAPQDLTLFFGSTLKPVINSLVQARLWREATQNVKHVPYSVLHVDTGINRLGMTEKEFELLLKNGGLREALNIEMVMSHLACAPDAAHPQNKKQLDLFRQLASRLPVMPLSLANTAGIYLGKKYHFQMVRPGIGLYGGRATVNPDQEVSKPAMSLMAPVLQVKDLKPGDTVGYTASFTVETPITIAIVAAGYADGIPVQAPCPQTGSPGHAKLQGKSVSIIGRVSMDLTILDVTNLKKTPRIGDWAEFRGENLESDAVETGRINYELLTAVGRRCRLLYAN